MTPREVAEHFHRHPETIRRDLRLGRIKGQKHANGKHWQISDLPDVRPLMSMVKKRCEVCREIIENNRKVLTTVREKDGGGGGTVIDRHRFCSVLCLKSYVDLIVIRDVAVEPEPETGFINAMRRVFSGRTS